MLPCVATVSYTDLFTLTFAISKDRDSEGGIVSVALSLELPPAAVSGCHILCCPDFPLAREEPAIIR